MIVTFRTVRTFIGVAGFGIVVIVGVVLIRCSDFLNGIGFLLQVLHFALEGGFKLTRSALEFPNGLPHFTADLGKLLGAEQYQGQNHNEHHFWHS